MSGDINPVDFPQSWDNVYAGGAVSPGRCEWSGFKRPYKWDVKTGKGTKGATITFTSAPPAEGSFKFYLWTADHFRQWDVFRPLLKYDPLKKKSTGAYDLYHPALADVEIWSCVTTSIGPLMYEGKGLWSVTVEMLEYSPAAKKNATATPTTAATNLDPNANPAPAAQDAQQTEIAALLAQATAP